MLDAAPRTPTEAHIRLVEVLAQRRVLLVVDDVWSDAAAQAFAVTGPAGRVLYTTRDPQVLTAAGARAHRVDALTPRAARAVAAAILRIDADDLPAAADDAFEQVGVVALAVALLAAAVAGGGSWERVAWSLSGAADMYGDHPYANALKAMQIAVAALPAELARALPGLAVFPPDTRIPAAAIAQYWAHTRGHTLTQTVQDLHVLAAANLLSLDGDLVEFHDLQHDYLLLHTGTLVLLHTALLDAYRTLLPDRDKPATSTTPVLAHRGHSERSRWWRLPESEPYIWNHLITHLYAAGDRRAMAATVTDPSYLVQA